MASRLSPILPSLPRATGLSAPGTRGRMGANMGEKMHLTKAHAPLLCLPPPPALCSLPGLPEYTPLLWPQSSYTVPVWRGPKSGAQRNGGQGPICLRTGSLTTEQKVCSSESGSRSLWVHGVKLLLFLGLLGGVQNQGLPAHPTPSLWQPCRRRGDPHLQTRTLPPRGLGCASGL